MKLARFTIAFLLLGFLVWSAGLKAAPADEEQTLSSRELIVLLDVGNGAPTPEDLVDRQLRGKALPENLGIGAPGGDAIRHPGPRQTGRPQGPIPRDRRLASSTTSCSPIFGRRPGGDPAGAAAQSSRALGRVQHSDARVRDSQRSVVPVDGRLRKSPHTGSVSVGGAMRCTCRTPGITTKVTPYVGVIDVGLDTTHPDLRAFHQVSGTNVFDGGNFRPQFAFDYGYSARVPTASTRGSRRWKVDSCGRSARPATAPMFRESSPPLPTTRRESPAPAGTAASSSAR